MSGGLEPVVVHVLASDGTLTLSGEAVARAGQELVIVFDVPVRIVGLFRGEEGMEAHGSPVGARTPVRVTFAAPELLAGGPWRRIDPPPCFEPEDDVADARLWECVCGYRTWSCPGDVQPQACARCVGVVPK